LLKAAADTEIEVNASDSGMRTATVVKQRDHKIGDVFGFKLVPIEIGQDADGKPVTSCVVEAVDAPVSAPATKAARLPKAAQTALRALAEATLDHGVELASSHVPKGAKVVTVEQWRQRCYRMGISASDSTARAKQSAFKRASEHLIGAGHVGVWDEHAWRTA
jgi:hypothetical protein